MSEVAPKRDLQGSIGDVSPQRMLKYNYGPILANKTLILSHDGNFLQLTFNELDWKMHVGHPAHP